MQKMKITELHYLLKMFLTHRICDIFKKNRVYFETNWQLKLAGTVNSFTNNLLPYLLKTFFRGAFS